MNESQSAVIVEDVFLTDTFLIKGRFKLCKIFSRKGQTRCHGVSTKA